MRITTHRDSSAYSIRRNQKEGCRSAVERVGKPAKVLSACKRLSRLVVRAAWWLYLLMTATGRLLESYAQGRAEREMTALLSRAPRFANRLVGDDIHVIPVESIHPGDLLLVRLGETIPVDGPLVSDNAVLNESSITGESLPVTKQSGALLLSGAINAGDALKMHAARTAKDSTFQGIIMHYDGWGWGE